MKNFPVRRTQDDIDELLRELEESGETVVTFAKRRGVPAQTVYGWTKRRREKRRKPPSGQRSKRDLVRVMVAGAEPATSIAYELVVDGVGTVRVPSGFDEGDLARLLRTLREGC